MIQEIKRGAPILVEMLSGAKYNCIFDGVDKRGEEMRLFASHVRPYNKEFDCDLASPKWKHKRSWSVVKIKSVTLNLLTVDLEEK